MVDPCTSMENWIVKETSMVKLWLQSILELLGNVVMANFLLGGQGYIFEKKRLNTNQSYNARTLSSTKKHLGHQRDP